MILSIRYIVNGHKLFRSYCIIILLLPIYDFQIINHLEQVNLTC